MMALLTSALTSGGPVLGALCAAGVAAFGSLRDGEPAPIHRTRVPATNESQAPTPSPRAVRTRSRIPAQLVTTARSRLVLLVVAVGFVAGPLGAAIGIASVLMVRRIRPVLAERQSRRDIERSVPDALDLFVLLLDAGLSARRCIEELAERGPCATRPCCVEVQRRLDSGMPFAEAIVVLRQRFGSSAVSLVDLLVSTDRSGLPMSQVIHQLSAEARAARFRRDQAEARKLPIKLSFPLVLCTLPSFVLLAIAPAVLAALSSLGSNAW